MHRTAPTLRTVPIALAVLGAAALAACSGSGGSGSSGAAGTSAASPSSSVPASTAHATATVTRTATSSPAGSAGSAGPSGTGATGLRDCAESQLRASIDPRPVKGSSTTGDYARIVDFTNTSSRSCLIHGYPGAAITYADGTQYAQATRTIRGKLLGLPTSQDTLPTVTLRPGAVASAGIEGVNRKEQGAAQAGCDDSFYPGILVTPPNTSTPVPFDVRWPKCFSFTVHPANIEKDPPR